jgi:hypothetical protein
LPNSAVSARVPPDLKRSSCRNSRTSLAHSGLGLFDFLGVFGMLAPYFRQSGPSINLCRRVWFEKGKIYRENRGQSPRVSASRGSNLFPHCGAVDPSLLPLDTVSRVSSSAGNSTPVSLPHRSTEASCSTPAPIPLRAEVPSRSSLSSSTGPPLEVTV